MHSYGFSPGDTIMVLKPAWPAVVGYSVMAVLLFLAPLITVPGTRHE